MNWKQELLTLLRESTIVQGLFTLAVTVTVCYLYIMQLSVPNELLSVWFAVIGFYFGGKVQERRMSVRGTDRHN